MKAVQLLLWPREKPGDRIQASRLVASYQLHCCWASSGANVGSANDLLHFTPSLIKWDFRRLFVPNVSGSRFYLRLLFKVCVVPNAYK